MVFLQVLLLDWAEEQQGEVGASLGHCKVIDEEQQLYINIGTSSLYHDR